MEHCRNELDKGGRTNAVIEEVNKQFQLITKLIDYIQEKLDAQDLSARRVITQNVNDFLVKFATNNYKAKVSEDFKFELTRPDVGKIDGSDGEKLLLALAFVSALVKQV